MIEIEKLKLLLLRGNEIVWKLHDVLVKSILIMIKFLLRDKKIVFQEQLKILVILIKMARMIYMFGHPIVNDIGGTRTLWGILKINGKHWFLVQ